MEGNASARPLPPGNVLRVLPICDREWYTGSGRTFPNGNFYFKLVWRWNHKEFRRSYEAERCGLNCYTGCRSLSLDADRETIGMKKHGLLMRGSPVLLVIRFWRSSRAQGVSAVRINLRLRNSGCQRLISSLRRREAVVGHIILACELEGPGLSNIENKILVKCLVVKPLRTQPTPPKYYAGDQICFL